MPDTDFGNWLKSAREVRRVTQSELENAAGLSLGYVSKVERGKIVLPGDDVRPRIHAVLGTTDDDLVEAGILKRVEYGGQKVYLPQRDVPSVIRIERLGQISTDDVIDGIRADLDSVKWSAALLEALQRQIRLIRDMQHGILNEPRASWEDGE